MPTAEMQLLTQRSSDRSTPRSTPSSAGNSAAGGLPQRAAYEPPQRLPLWATVLVLCLATASLGASLAYMGTAERPPGAAYALDRDWAAASPLGLRGATHESPAMVVPVEVCRVCGRVEAVVAVNGSPDATSGLAAPAHAPGTPRAHGKKPLFEVQVRMEDGRTHTVQVEKPMAVGTQVTLEHGVLRRANA
jgi:hypothetical protein